MRIIVLVFALLVSFSAPALERQRQWYTEAESALKRGNIKQFKALQNKLVDYPLAPYLEMKAMQRRFRIKQIKTYQKFIKQHQYTPIAANMESWLQRRLAKTRQWDLIVNYLKNAKDDEYHCIYLNARLKRREAPENIWPAVAKLWLTPESLPKQCDPVLLQWKKAGQLTDELLHQRLIGSIINKEYALAEYLAKDLSTEQRQAISGWIRLFRSPTRLNKQRLPKGLGQHWSIILQDALYAKITKRTRLDKLPLQIDLMAEKSKLEWELLPKATRAIALKLALAGEDAAEIWLQRSLKQKEDTVIRDWYLRWLVGHQRWQDLSEQISALPEAEQQRPRWRYWQARALAATGAELTSKSMFQRISEERHYYGVMASWQLDQPVTVREAEMDNNVDLLNELRQHDFILRAKEFFLLGKVNQARLEWNAGVRRLGEKYTIAAAQLAHEWGWYDRTIFTMRLPGAKQHMDQLDLRFPIAWREPVQQQSIRYSLPPALIYAIARLESDFMFDARSPVGAYGLMQLLPGTAKLVARGYAIPLRGNRDLINPQINIRLGSAYLHRLSKRFDRNFPLAIAAYNAGPNRVKKWLPGSPMDPDIWIETIPFKETRNYVQNSLIYTAIYQQHLGGSLHPRQMLNKVLPADQVAKHP